MHNAELQCKQYYICQARHSMVQRLSTSSSGTMPLGRPRICATTFAKCEVRHENDRKSALAHLWFAVLDNVETLARVNPRFKRHVANPRPHPRTPTHAALTPTHYHTQELSYLIPSRSDKNTPKINAKSKNSLAAKLGPAVAPFKNLYRISGWGEA